jgi:hypothetical protein
MERNSRVFDFCKNVQERFLVNGGGNDPLGDAVTLLRGCQGAVDGRTLNRNR